MTGDPTQPAPTLSPAEKAKAAAPKRQQPVGKKRAKKKGGAA